MDWISITYIKGVKMKSALKMFFEQGFKLITLLLAVSALSFILVKLSPVDPVQQYVLGVGSVSPSQRLELEEYWGVNQPPIEQYSNWLKAIIRGDFGVSLLYRRPVLTIIKERFINSLALMSLAWIFSGVMGFVLGCVMGMHKNKIIDRIIRKVCLIICSLPTFWIGLLFLLLFSVYLGWFPVGFSSPIGVVNEKVTFLQKLHHMILPALTLSFASFANLALHTRQKLVDVLESNYVLFAKANGESDWSILKRHGVRNTIIPAITLQFAGFAELFGGSILAENVFSYPGLGLAVSAAGLNSDVPLLLGITLFSALFVFSGNLIADILYGVIDPQVKEGRYHG